MARNSHNCLKPNGSLKLSDIADLVVFCCCSKIATDGAVWFEAELRFEFKSMALAVLLEGQKNVAIH